MLSGQSAMVDGLTAGLVLGLGRRFVHAMVDLFIS
jgi:hypothetical protein